MRRVEVLINEIRELTGNQRYDANSGVSQYLMVRALKNAQVQLFKHIVNAKTMVFTKEVLTNVVNAQELYSYPEDIYLMNIETMQWSVNPGQNGIDYINLFKGNSKDRMSSENGYAFAYIPRGDGFLLSPPLSNGVLRTTYVKRLFDLEKRSGKISVATMVGDQLTALTLNSAEISFDQSYLNLLQSLCVVDRFGNIKAKNIVIDSVASNGVVTLSAHTLSAGESIAVGDFVTAGDWTANISVMPDICEAHLIKHATYEIRYGDASKWTAEALQDMAMSLETILSSFGNPNHDVTEIPITCTDYLVIW